jgi:putative ABC transport system permease protein
MISYVKLRPHTDVAAMEKSFPTFVNKYGGQQLKSLGMTKELHLEPVRTIHTTTGFKGIELSTPASPTFLNILMSENEIKQKAHSARAASPQSVPEGRCPEGA